MSTRIVYATCFAYAQELAALKEKYVRAEREWDVTRRQLHNRIQVAAEIWRPFVTPSR